MSRQRDERARILLLEQLRDILAAMKNLALSETGKLIATQAYRKKYLDELALIASATSSAFAVEAPALKQPPDAALYVLIGSQRGFCADFNERILSAWNGMQTPAGSRLIVLGDALAERLDASPASPCITTVSGAAGSDEIEQTLLRTIQCATEQMKNKPCARLVVLSTSENLILETPLQSFRITPRTAPIPELFISPQTFAREFLDRYADALLHTLLASSLLAENRARLAHMNGAINRIDEQLTILYRRRRRARQEEITQEIEAVLVTQSARPR